MDQFTRLEGVAAPLMRQRGTSGTNTTTTPAFAQSSTSLFGSPPPVSARISRSAVRKVAAEYGSTFRS